MALTLAIDKKTLPSSVDGRSKVAGTAAGTLLVAKYGGNVLYRSVDGGGSWTTETFPFSFCDVIAWNGSYFLGAYNGSWCKSTTGAPGSWTTGSFATVRANQKLLWDGSSTWMLARLYGGGSSWAEMAYSTDGTTWSYSALTTTTDAYELLYDGTKWCVMGNQEASPFNEHFWSSPTGATWTQGGQVDAAVGLVYEAFVYTGTAYIVSAGSSGTVGYSTTGATWAASAESGKVMFAAANAALKHDGSGGGWKTSVNGNTWSSITPTVTGSGSSWVPRLTSSGFDGKFYSAEGTVLGILTLAEVTPPFWQNLVGTFEVP